MSDQPLRSSSLEEVAAGVDRTWRERGLPRELLERARGMHISNTQLDRMLSWNAPAERFLERMEEEIHWADLLLNGTMRFRQVTLADNDAFCALWAHSPEPIGEWDVTAERGPNAFAQFQLQERPVLNALFDQGQMVACVSFALRDTLVGGERISVRYGQAMRVHQDHRRHGYAHWVRSLPGAVGISRPTQIQYDYIRSHNMNMAQWNQKYMPKVDSVPVRDDEVPGIPVTVLQYPARRATGAAKAVRLARSEDIERCVYLINRTHAGRDLFRPYTPEFLTERLDIPSAETVPPGWRPAYCRDDFYVVERGGAIVACAGLWDRGRDLRERWRHRETGEERVISVAALLDIGCAEGHEQALADLIEDFIGMTGALGRDYLLAPLETLPNVEGLLAHNEPVPETRYLQWRGETPAITAPTHLDLVYW